MKSNATADSRFTLSRSQSLEAESAAETMMPSLYDAPRLCVRTLRIMFRLRGGTLLPHQ